MQERGRLLPGTVYNDEACASPETATLKASLVASSPNTSLITFTTNDVERVAVSVGAPGAAARVCVPDQAAHRGRGHAQAVHRD